MLDFFSELLKQLTDFEAHFVIGMLCCILAGFIIGSEREKINKPAGIATHTFVMLGSMLFTMMSGLDHAAPSRIAANIVTGVGFIGAGMIFKSSGQKVENLTTAAGVWVSSALGMALGFRLYFVAAVTTVFLLIVLHLIPHPYKPKPNK